MELWAPDAIDLLGPGTIVFEDEAFGEFGFIAVRGWMDCRFTQRDGRPTVADSQDRDDLSSSGTE